jgi:1-acyl-sn-glycerol-3-phosphate acyltransferase
MAYLRAALLAFVLAAVLGIVVPFQALARKFGWPVHRAVPGLVCRALCAVLRLRVRAHGALAGAGPRLIVANHVSWTDILAIASVQPICFVAKAEVAGWPALGALARVQDTIFLDRTARFALPAINARMADKMLAGEDVVLFPEATTGDGNRLKHFHAVHFAAARDLLARNADVTQVSIVPVAVAYTRRDGLPLGWIARKTVAWYGDSDFLPHLWSLLKEGPVDCEMHFGASLAFNRGDDRKIVALAARAHIRHLSSRAILGR